MVIFGFIHLLGVGKLSPQDICALLLSYLFNHEPHDVKNMSNLRLWNVMRIAENGEEPMEGIA